MKKKAGYITFLCGCRAPAPAGVFGRITTDCHKCKAPGCSGPYESLWDQEAADREGLAAEVESYLKAA